MPRRGPLDALGARLALAFLGVTMGALAILVTLVLVAAERDVTQLAHREQDETVSAVAQAAAAAYTEAGRWDGADYDGVVALAGSANSHVTVLDGDGRTVATSPGPARTARARTVPVEVAGQRVGSVRVGFATGGLPTGERHLRDDLVAQVAAAAGAAALIALAAAIVVSRRITRPVTVLTSAARAMEAGERSRRVGDVTTVGELAELAAAFDRMAETLSWEERLRRGLVADIAHELRTPVTLLRGSLEAMTDGVVAPTSEQLSLLYDDVLRLGRLVGDLETLAAADAAGLNLERHWVDLAAVAHAAGSALAHQFEAADLSLRLRLIAAPVRGDANRLHQVVTNLLTNALKFTPASGRVTVETHAEGATAVLAVTDTGIGIASDELPRVFERFWRGNGVRTVAGSGIGLTVVDQLVRAHGGVVAIESELARGTRMEVRLPVAE